MEPITIHSERDGLGARSMVAPETSVNPPNQQPRSAQSHPLRGPISEQEWRDRPLDVRLRDLLARHELVELECVVEIREIDPVDGFRRHERTGRILFSGVVLTDEFKRD